MEWISVEDGLPKGEHVRAKLKDGSHVNCYCMDDGDYYWLGGGSAVYILEEFVTHWMPLPPAPEGKK